MKKAKVLFEWGQPLFYNEEEMLYCFTSALEADVPVRKVETYDNATHAVNSVMAENCFLLGIIFKSQ